MGACRHEHVGVHTKSAAVLPGHMCALTADNLLNHTLLPPPPAADFADLKSANTSVLPGLGSGSSPGVSAHEQSCGVVPRAHSLGLSGC